MGYYTYFSLRYYASEEDTKALMEFEPSKSDFNTPNCIKELIREEEDSHEWKWYSWEADIKKLASMFPSVLFVLNGVGEESDDVWEWRGKGDKSEYHEVEMPKFTELVLPNEE